MTCIVCLYTYECVHVWRGQRTTSAMWVLRTEFRSSALTARDFTCRAISSAHMPVFEPWLAWNSFWRPDWLWT